MTQEYNEMPKHFDEYNFNRARGKSDKKTFYYLYSRYGNEIKELLSIYNLYTYCAVY